MGILTKETKAAIRRGAWCKDTSIPAHLKTPAGVDPFFPHALRWKVGAKPTNSLQP